MEVHRKRLAKFHDAIFNSELVTVNRLLSKGVSVNATHKGETAFTLAIACIIVDQRHGYGDPDRQRARELIADAIFNDSDIDPRARSKKKRTALHEAVSMGRDDWVRRLLCLGASVDKQDVEGDTPVVLAIWEDKASCLRTIIENTYVDLNHRNKDGLSLLHLACRRLSAGAARELIKQGCAVNGKGENGESALMIAYKGWDKLEIKLLPKWLEITELLIQAGCDLNARDYQGKTLLEQMIESNCVYGVCVLAEGGCDVGLVNANGLTSVQAAICYGHHELARYLLHYGSRWEGDSQYASGGNKVHTNCPPFSIISSVMQSFKHAAFRTLKFTEELLFDLIESAHSSAYHIDLGPINEAIETNTSRQSCKARKKILREIRQNIEELAIVFSKSPLSLQHQTKVRIRDAIGATNILSKICRLPIPMGLKRFINLGVALELSRYNTTVHLHAAILENDPDKVIQAMEKGADASASMGGHRALELALHLGSDEVVSALFKHLSSQAFPRSAPSCFSDSGDTALHLVARTGRLCHVQAAVQLSRGDLSVINAQGRSPLEEAILGSIHSGIDTAEAILLHGAMELFSPKEESLVVTINFRNMGVTLLHVASAAGAFLLVSMLLKSHSCSPNCVDIFGYTPLQLAVSQVRTACITDEK